MRHGRCSAVLLTWLAVLAAGGRPYVFLREAGGAAGGRRVLGGEPARLDAARLLQDRWGAALCSGVEIRPRWVLTAAHCVEPRVATAGAGSLTVAVVARYRHPQYSVRQQDGDVIALSHDVGLLLTERALPGTARADWRRETRRGPGDGSVLVYGFGESASGGPGTELRAARVWPRDCPRTTWVHCRCAASGGGGVCAGDSGGPAVRAGRVVALASLGPLRCASPALSVLTELAPYRRLVRATMSARQPRMREVSYSGAARPLRLSHLTVAALLVYKHIIVYVLVCRSRSTNVC